MSRADLSSDARRSAEVAARKSYGRLLSILASRTRDIAGAEDALADAFAAALSTWPERGVPERPEAWLLTAARRSSMHRVRHDRVAESAVGELLIRMGEPSERSQWDGVDERSKLLFVCAHPAIDETVRTPLMLQTVLGLDAERIASAFLVRPSSMSQRLVRAKTKIKQAGLRFEVPELSELGPRLDDVLRAIYVAYGAGWEDQSSGRGLASEAILLGRTVVEILPGEPEARGLLALMLYCESRRDARRDDEGRFVPLPQQDPARWSRTLIIEAEQLLTSASSAGKFGRFQCEAAIQSVHAQRALTGQTRYDALCLLYDLLLLRAPSVGVAMSRVAALIEAGNLDGATSALGALSESEISTYQPYWVVRARLAERLGDLAAARRALARALSLTEDAAVRRFLTERLKEAGS